MWVRTLCPLSSSTRNMALGRGSTTVPSTSMASFFAKLSGYLSNMPKDARAKCPGDRASIGSRQGERLRSGGQDLRTDLGDGDGVLEVRGQAAIASDHR